MIIRNLKYLATFGASSGIGKYGNGYYFWGNGYGEGNRASDGDGYSNSITIENGLENLEKKEELLCQ
jgi:hypothetical protein